MGGMGDGLQINLCSSAVFCGYYSCHGFRSEDLPSLLSYSFLREALPVLQLLCRHPFQEQIPGIPGSASG